jgi:hypothetical protein
MKLKILARVAALLGLSAYAAASNVPSTSMDLDSPMAARLREQLGGQLIPLPFTQTRWLLADLETAEHLADSGDLSMAARLMRSARKDGTFAGVLATRTGGLVRLPKKFRGDGEIVEALEIGHDSVRSVFDEMFPPTELANFAADGILLGVAVGILEPVEGRDYPVFVRLEPENLRYRWAENRWYYVTVVGQVRIDPGQGRWILHTPGGRIAPWQNGLWRAIGQAWIDKQHARMHKANWEGKLANPARVAIAPQGASEEQKQGWFKRVMAWGVNTVFGLTPGYDVKLLESNGRGYECFLETIKASDRDMVIAITASTVLVDGGTGFINGGVFEAIRADLIQSDAQGLSYTLNTQGIPPFVLARWPEEELSRTALVEWDTTPPEDRTKEAAAAVQAGAAIAGLNAALAETDDELDVATFAKKFAIPTKKRAPGVAKAAAPAANAKTPANDTQEAA